LSKGFRRRLWGQGGRFHSSVIVLPKPI
jgi:hypothetical protein